MTLEILIDVDNDAFLYATEDGGTELSRILAEVGALAVDVERTHPSTTIRDINGNTVGHWRIVA